MLVLAACSSSASKESKEKDSIGSGGAGHSSVAGRETERTPPVSETARKRATAAYLDMWRDTAQAAKTSDWKSPRLARHATGEALKTITRGMYADHRNGLIAKGMPENAPKVTKVTPVADPTTVVISDCGDSSHWLKYRKKTGELADDKPGGRQSITAEVEKQGDGGWKVTRFAVWEVGSC
ncbi:hypothetical protein ABT039_09550 [Streptomyces lasiicapitis]|uniref:hypothetical protein n=1 Tax=Streptomyces lasiicapitis TaxID=1923961 RepID=UPI00332E25AC